MPSNKIIQIAVLVILMLLSMWAISALLEVRASTRNVILGVGGFLILLSVLWRKIPLDAKFLFLCLLGYSLGGKGFAYVSPYEPVFIGEICLALCGCAFLLRARQWGLIDTPIHKWIWIYLIYSGIHVYVDYHLYRLVAIRDSATAYYSFFFIASFVMFRNQLVMTAFEKILKIALVFGVIQAADVTAHKMGVIPLVRFSGYWPHGDAFIPICTAAVLFFLARGMEVKKISYILFGALAAGLLVILKTSALCAVVAAIAVAILWGRVRALLVPAVFLGAVSFIMLAVAMMVNPNFFTEHVVSGETAATFGMEGGEFVGLQGTSWWRWTWWMNIWRNTMAIAPWWGQGFGADITGPFLQEWLGVQGDPAGYARYPHCIFFTIIGRLGLIGLFIFSALFTVICVFTLRYCKRFFQSPDRRDADLIATGIIIGGLVNGVLQATYEMPHGAIPHWVCLGYMAARYYGPRATHILPGDQQEVLSAEKNSR